MSEPQRRQVRVRRSPKVGVFLAIGAVVGALIAVIAVNVTPADTTTPAVQAIGFLILLLAPVGALVGGAVALVLDAVLERRARTVEAERLPTTAPVVEDVPDPEEPAEAADPAGSARPADPEDRADRP